MKTLLKKALLIAFAMGLLAQTRTQAMQEVLEYTDLTYSYTALGLFAVAYFAVQWYQGAFDIPALPQQSQIPSKKVSFLPIKKDQKKEHASLRIQAILNNASKFEEKLVQKHEIEKKD